MAAMSPKRRVQLFGALVTACVAGAVVAVVVAAGGAGTSAAQDAGDALVAAREEERPALLFRNVASGSRATEGRVAVAGLDARRARQVAPLSCERVHFSAPRGLCVARGAAFAAGYRAEVFDDRFKVRFSVDVPGIPSRARVSPDGRYGTVTMFVEGHSYAEQGAFSTNTTLIDLVKGFKIADLEQFAITRNGTRVTADDVNFWGVTFASDSDIFYATLATGGTTYLIKGSVSERSAHTIHTNVECPSLSPDGTRIGYKKRVGGKRIWRLHVLDLASGRETPLAESRGVDDQVEWLDGERLAYGIDRSVWVVPADGTGAPVRLRRGAESPAAVRW
jgi:hypothetical protein